MGPINRQQHARKIHRKLIHRLKFTLSRGSIVSIETETQVGGNDGLRNRRSIRNSPAESFYLGCVNSPHCGRGSRNLGKRFCGNLYSNLRGTVMYTRDKCIIHELGMEMLRMEEVGWFSRQRAEFKISCLPCAKRQNRLATLVRDRNLAHSTRGNNDTRH